MKGNTGAIRDIKIIPGSNILASCGLDRFLRTYNYKTMEDMPHIYLKNKLTALHFIEYDNVESNDKEEEDEEDDGEESEIFESFEDEEEDEGNDDGEED